MIKTIGFLLLIYLTVFIFKIFSVALFGFKIEGNFSLVLIFFTTLLLYYLLFIVFDLVRIARKKQATLVQAHWSALVDNKAMHFKIILLALMLVVVVKIWVV